MTWEWDELLALPRETFTVDIHCVTQWTIDTTWTGVSLDVLLAEAGPLDARFAVAHSADGYETNLPLADLTGGRAWLVWEYEGAPLEPPHGGPARLLVPHLYFWKSAKWVRALELFARRPSRLLGGQRLPRPRGPLAGAAVPRAR